MQTIYDNFLSIFDNFVDNTTSIVKEWTSSESQPIFSDESDFLDEMEKGIVNIWKAHQKPEEIEMTPIPTYVSFNVGDIQYLDKVILRRLYPLYDIEAARLTTHPLREIVIL